MLDHSVEQIETVRRFGWPAFYGDATRLDLLRTAGAAQARVFVLAIDDVEQSVRVAQLVREHFPRLQIVAARAQRRATTTGCAALGVTLIERETLDSALMSARSVLELMGWQRHAARNQALRFRAPQHRADRAHGAALRRRGAADRAGQAGPRAARGACGRRSAPSRAGARRAPAGAAVQRVSR